MVNLKDGDFVSNFNSGILDFISSEQIGIPELLKMMFQNYQEKKIDNSLYSIDDFIPQNLIKLYYGSCRHRSFESIAVDFKKRYIFNENVLENVRKSQERAGLGVVYDYITGNGWQKIDNIYVVCKIHQLLYSKVPNLEFGGSFRNMTSYVTNGDDNIAIDYSLIPSEMSKLYPLYEDIAAMAEKISITKNADDLIEYINRCIDLKCRLIKIHPFADGNGRTSRALLNIFFKRVNLPPTYVKASEKSEYIMAMDKAIRLNDPTAIRRFYYYKICDSIIELDINMQIDDPKEKDEKTK